MANPSPAIQLQCENKAGRRYKTSMTACCPHKSPESPPHPTRSLYLPTLPTYPVCVPGGLTFVFHSCISLSLQRSYTFAPWTRKSLLESVGSDILCRRTAKSFHRIFPHLERVLHPRTLAMRMTTLPGRKDQKSRYYLLFLPCKRFAVFLVPMYAFMSSFCSPWPCGRHLSVLDPGLSEELEVE